MKSAPILAKALIYFVVLCESVIKGGAVDPIFLDWVFLINNQNPKGKGSGRERYVPGYYRNMRQRITRLKY